ncbi:MAG: ATP-binding cassette domain-containing protein [Phycisphaerales bacterium]
MNSAPATPPLLEVRDLVVEFGHGHGARRVVDGVSLRLESGRTLGLVGESGSGKSTLSRVVMGLLAPAAGHVLIDGLDVHASHGASLRGIRRRVQMIFQDPAGSLNPRLRVRDIVAEPLIVHGLPWKDRVGALLEECGMPASSMDRFPHEFSGGQRQRIAIARALALRPALVICDEPTSALDVSVQAQILNLLQDLQRSRGIAYLFITHDLGVVAHMADRIAVMRAGRIVEEGDAVDVLRSPADEYTKTLLGA